MSTAIVPANIAAIEQVLINGNLKQLGAEQRVSYYNQLCTSLGLNPLTRPFEYLELQGKLTLYAKKDCTEQLRKIHSVSVVEVKTERFEDVFVVTAKGQDGSGRTDSSTGAVTVGNLKGDALANAIMKAETKAKRRLTLSICGLGFLDETEIETIPQAHAETPTAPLLEAEKKLLCVDCLKEVDACTIRGNFVTLEKVRQASKRDFNDESICGPCQVLRHSAKRKASTPTPPTIEAQPEKDNSPDPYFADMDGKKLVSGTVKVVSSPTVKGKGTVVSLKFADDSWLGCWHTSLHEALATARGKRCVFVYSINGAFKNLEEIRKIGDQEFDGKVPVVQLNEHPGNQTKFEITDDDVPF